MSIETNYMVERLQFRERYRTLTDDDLARLSIDENRLVNARFLLASKSDDITHRRKQFRAYVRTMTSIARSVFETSLRYQTHVFAPVRERW